MRFDVARSVSRNRNFPLSFVDVKTLNEIKTVKAYNSNRISVVFANGALTTWLYFRSTGCRAEGASASASELSSLAAGGRAPQFRSIERPPRKKPPSTACAQLVSAYIYIYI